MPAKEFGELQPKYVLTFSLPCSSSSSDVSIANHVTCFARTMMPSNQTCGNLRSDHGFLLACLLRSVIDNQHYLHYAATAAAASKYLLLLLFQLILLIIRSTQLGGLLDHNPAVIFNQSINLSISILLLLGA